MSVTLEPLLDPRPKKVVVRKMVAKSRFGDLQSLDINGHPTS